MGKAPQKTLTPSQTAVYRSLVEQQGLSPEAAAEAVLRAGKQTEQGVALTLPELTENPTLLGFEARLRESKGAAGDVESAFMQKRPDNLRSALTTTIKQDIGKISSPDVAGRNISSAAGNVVGKVQDRRAALAQPFYDEAYKQVVPDNVLGEFSKNPVIMESMKTVAKDSVWKTALGDAQPNSVAFLDVVKNTYSEVKDINKTGTALIPIEQHEPEVVYTLPTDVVESTEF
jgi:hypothetical protein